MTTLNDVELVVIDDDEPHSLVSAEDNVGMTDAEVAEFLGTALIAADQSDMTARDEFFERMWDVAEKYHSDSQLEYFSVTFGDMTIDIPLGSHVVTASGFDPLEHPRDPSDGQFTDKPGSGIAKALKKAIPAIIYKKHEDRAVVAMSPSGDKRIRWSAGDKKFIHESREKSAWKTDKFLTKTEAYNDLKTEDKWVEPHKESSDNALKVEKPTVPKVVASKVVTSDVKKPEVKKLDNTGDNVKKQARIKEIDQKIVELHEAAKPHADYEAELLDKDNKGKVLKPHELAQSNVGQKELQKLAEQGRVLAEEQLNLRMEIEGSIFGGDDANAEKWKDAVTGGSVHVIAPNADKAKLNKQADQYRVKDKMTIENNRELRSGDPSASAKAWRGRMEKLIKSQTLANDTVLHRGAALKPETIMQLKPGSIMTDKGVMSTSSNIKDAYFYTKARADGLPGALPVRFEMRVPKDHNAADVDYNEFVLAPNTPVKIISVKKLDDGFIRIVTEMA